MRVCYTWFVLEKYKEKRDFEKTQEPRGENPRPVGAPPLLKGVDNRANKPPFAKGVPVGRGFLSFVIQHHFSRHVHFDFRLEHKGVLLSWAVPKGVSTDPRDKRLAIHVEDHPLEYRHFEGVIPEGEYGAGEVKIWDKGWYEPLTDVEGALAGRHALKIMLHGEKLDGLWTLVQTKRDPKQWLLIAG